ncbi:MAG TPA: sigma-54-dependent Fis family transcriptional regulator, partial [Desulfobacterales bacterium]|nr:sigma-54-dependent Fis family transcriptional regulator [Desulfobacterales bacterium]
MTSKPRILLVDDDSSLLRLLSIRLTKGGYEVDAVENAEQALGHLPAFRPHLVITDLQMEGMDGMELFNALQQSNPSLPVMILTAHGTIPDAVAATQRGVFTYLTKPFDSRELLESVEKAIEFSGQPQKTKLSSQDGLWRKNIISRSATMRELLAETERVAATDVSVFIQSESGTGKELLAKAIHEAGKRKDQPFVPVNCSAFPEQLLESELFGHKKGAFTGASSEHYGLFQAAHGGTLFLDEIGEMPIGFQAKLLRALQENEVRPVGSTQAVRVDVRIISATNQNLEKSVDAGTFRADLYYRLNVVMLELPSLSQRREDIPLLVEQFLDDTCERVGQTRRKFSHEAIDQLISAPWPGNV